MIRRSLPGLAIAAALVGCGTGSQGRASLGTPQPAHTSPEASGDDSVNPQPGDADDAGTDAGDDADATPVGLLDCAWLTGTNCWQTAVASADSCLPLANSVGTLSADGSTCNYADGTVIAFQTPIAPGVTVTVPGFTLSADDSTCVTYSPGTSASLLTTPGGTVTIESDRDAGTLTVVCPDDTTYSGLAAGLSGCPNAVPGFDTGVGGLSTEAGTSESLSISLGGTGFGSSGELFVFACRSD